MGFFKVLRHASAVYLAAQEARWIRDALRGDLVPRMKQGALEHPEDAFFLVPEERDLLIRVADGLELIGEKLKKI